MKHDALPHREDALARRLDPSPSIARRPRTPALRVVDGLRRARPRPTHGNEPLLAPSSTFETRRLVATGRARLELRRSWQEHALAGTFAVLGTGVVTAGLSQGVHQGLGASVLLPLAGGLAMIATGLLLWRVGGHAVLDGRAREFRRTGALLARGGVALRVPFEEVSAVQRLTCRFADEEASWTVHQLNLVRLDGSRVHVCSHVDASLAASGAERIARLIGVDVTVWPEPADEDGRAD